MTREVPKAKLLTMQNYNFIMKNIALDISKKDFYFAHNIESKVEIKKMMNEQKDFIEFSKKFPAQSYRVVMEATGNYHKPLAYFLLENQYQVSVISGSVSHYYGKVKNSNIKNDPKDAKNLLDYANRHEDRLPEFKLKEEQIRQLTYLRKGLNDFVKDKRRVENRLHSAKYDKYYDERVIQDMEETIKYFEDKIAKINQDIEEIVGDKFAKMSKDLQSIPGVGPAVSLHSIALLKSFPRLSQEDSMEKYLNEVLKYVGLAPSEYTSGTSVKGASKVKKGACPQLKSALYMACVSVCCNSKSNSAFKTYYKALRERGQCFKRAITNTMAKLLRTIVFIAITEQKYDREKHLNAVAK